MFNGFLMIVCGKTFTPLTIIFKKISIIKTCLGTVMANNISKSQGFTCRNCECSCNCHAVECGSNGGACCSCKRVTAVVHLPKGFSLSKQFTTLQLARQELYNNLT